MTHQHFGKAPFEFHSVGHRLPWRATDAATPCVWSTQTSHAEARLTGLKRRAALDTTDKHLTHTAIAFAGTALHDPHCFHSRGLIYPPVFSHAKIVTHGNGGGQYCHTTRNVNNDDRGSASSLECKSLFSVLRETSICERLEPVRAGSCNRYQAVHCDRNSHERARTKA